jgi:hypothetical protein
MNKISKGFIELIKGIEKQLIVLVMLLILIASKAAAGLLITPDFLIEKGYRCTVQYAIDSTTANYYYSKYGKHYNFLEVFMSQEQDTQYLILYYYNEQNNCQEYMVETFGETSNK